MRASTPPRRRRLRVLIPCVATLLSLLTGVPAAYAASTLVVTVPTDATHRYLGGWPIAIRSTSALDENHSYIHYTWPNMDETPRSASLDDIGYSATYRVVMVSSTVPSPVTATWHLVDLDGNTANGSATFAVDPYAPVPSLTGLPETIHQGDSVHYDVACESPAKVIVCEAQGDSPGVLDTSTVGRFAVTVRTEDEYHYADYRSVGYTVQPPPAGDPGPPQDPTPDWITGATLQQQVYPSQVWTDVPNGARVVQGNPLRAVVTVHNPTDSVGDYQLLAEDVATHTPLSGTVNTLGLTPGSTWTRFLPLDTSHSAWAADGTPQLDPVHLEVLLTAPNADTGAARRFDVAVTPEPLVLVHGYKSNAASSWGTFAPIARSGHPLLTTWAVGDGQVPGTMNTGDASHPFQRTNTIAENAAQEARYIEGVRTRTGAWHVDVLAHSMGGLISRYYIQELMPDNPVDDRPVVDRLIQMGTPNRGSQLADVLLASGVAGAKAIPLYPATLQLSTGYVDGIFDHLITDLRGVPISNLVGTNLPLLVLPGAAFVNLYGDGIVPAYSARWTLADTMDSPRDFHTAMTDSQTDFDTYVLPHLRMGWNSAPPMTQTVAPAPLAPQSVQLPTNAYPSRSAQRAVATSVARSADPADAPTDAATDAPIDAPTGGPTPAATGVPTGGTDSPSPVPTDLGTGTGTGTGTSSPPPPPTDGPPPVGPQGVLARTITVKAGASATVALVLPAADTVGVTTGTTGIAMQLRDPQGVLQEAGDGTSAFASGVTAASTGAGAWSLTVTNTTGASLAVPLSVWVIGASVGLSVYPSLIDDPQSPSGYDGLVVASFGGPGTSTRPRFTAMLSDQPDQPAFTMYDDGTHGDDRPSDGLFSADLGPLAPGEHLVTVKAAAKGVALSTGATISVPTPLNHLSVTVPTGGGTVVRSIDRADWRADQTVTLTPVAGPLARFDSWIVDGRAVTANPLVLAMDTPHDVQAEFTGQETPAELVSTSPPDRSVEGQAWVFEPAIAGTTNTPWQVIADYGDGTGTHAVPSDNAVAHLAHVYAQDGTYPVTVTVTGSSGISSTTVLSAVVQNARPAITFSGHAALIVAVGTPVTLQATFTDQGVLDAHTATMGFGDDTSAVAVVDARRHRVSATHTYTSTGLVYPRVEISDDGGSTVGTVLTPDGVRTVRVVDVAELPSIAFPAALDAATTSQPLPADVTAQFRVALHDAGTLYEQGTPAASVRAVSKLDARTRSLSSTGLITPSQAKAVRATLATITASIR